MEVTHTVVGEVIEHIFTMKPYVSDEYVSFGLEADYFKAECVLHVFEAMLETKDEPAQQGMQIWVRFCHEELDRMNFSKFSWPEILELCRRLQDELNWGTLLPSLVDEHTIEISLYRSIDVTLSDVRMALNQDLRSEFLRTLKRLLDEWEELSPILSGVSTGQITSFEGIELLMQEPASYV